MEHDKHISILMVEGNINLSLKKGERDTCFGILFPIKHTYWVFFISLHKEIIKCFSMVIMLKKA